MTLVINPGTGPVGEATEENAINSIKFLIHDSEKKGISFNRLPDEDENGRFGFELISENHDKTINVSMPGCDTETVRKGKPWESPRLYVDGSSWLWGYALDFIQFDED